MNKLLFFLFWGLLPLAANAQTVEIDGIYYTLNTSTKTAEVSSNPNSYSGDVVIPAVVNYNGSNYDVTSIGSSAFSYDSGLASVTIPENVVTIGNYAFIRCSGLTSVTIPESVTGIGDAAFSGCSGLTSVKICDIVKWCQIEFASWSSNPLSYAHELYLNDEIVQNLIIPDDVTNLGNYVFYNCRSLTSVTIPESVTNIGNSAFYYCSSLISVTIPNSVTDIGEKAFYECRALESLKLSDNLKIIKNSSFSYCTKLKSLTIPASMEYIYADAFSYCSALKNVKVLAETPPFLNDKAFSNYNIPLLVPVGCKEVYQSAQGWKNFTTISDSRYTLMYMVDGEEYKSYLIESGTAITPEAEPTKETYKFSGWSDIPEIMPNHDVVVNGTFERYFDVGHLAKVINFVMKSNAAASDVALFDLNSDEELNIGDIILIVRNILSHDTNSMAAIGRRAGKVIDLTQYTAAQFDAKMADGKDIKLVGSMAQTHQLMCQKKDANTYSVVVFSLSNQLMTPENGHIIEMDGVETVGNLIAAKPSGETDCYQSLPVSTGIKQMASENRTAVIYDLKGNRLKSGKSLEKGVYIVNGKKTVVR